jgi:phosphatidylinositol alpha-mannosyltransferase
VRIVLACPYSWDAPGGVQVHIRELASQLGRRGHEVLILAPGRRPGSDPSVRIVGRPFAVRYQGTVAPISPWPWSILSIGRALRAFGPDVLHAHEPIAPSTSMLAVLRSRVPAVGTFHAHAERSALFDVAAPFLRFVWRRLAVRVAVSEAASRFVTSRLGDGVRVIPNGVDLELFARAEPADGLPPGRRLLWVGRLDRQKGFPVAVRAFAELAREFTDLRFVVVGDGRDRAAVNLVPSELRRRIHLVGTVRHELLSAYHAAADVFVSAAVGQESFGMVLVEAMAAGLPVVASDIAGYREVVRRDVDGLLVPPGDSQALARAVRRVLTEPDLAKRLAAAGRARARRYGWEVVVQEIESAYRDALGAAGGPARGSAS